MLWELVFMLVVLKIPVIYLCAVVWWAIKAEPRPPEGAGTVAQRAPGPDCDWRTRRARIVRRGPLPRGGSPIARPRRVANARVQVRS